MIRSLCARHLKPLAGVEDPQADVARIALSVRNCLVALALFFPETKDRRAVTHDSPALGVVADGHFHPGDEVLLGRHYLNGVVKGRFLADLQNHLSEPSRSKAGCQQAAPPLHAAPGSRAPPD